jgi:uncharacterized protein YozE (UPF0346 family)
LLTKVVSARLIKRERDGRAFAEVSRLAEVAVEERSYAKQRRTKSKFEEIIFYFKTNGSHKADLAHEKMNSSRVKASLRA